MKKPTKYHLRWRFATELKTFRHRHWLTQRYLGHIIGYDAGQISMFERRKRYPSALEIQIAYNKMREYAAGKASE